MPIPHALVLLTNFQHRIFLTLLQEISSSHRSTNMEKKKLIDHVAKNYKAKQQPEGSAVFFTVKSDPSTARLIDLYDRQIVIFTNQTRNEVWGRILFDFDLIFELLRGETEEERKKKSGTPSGLKFQRGEESIQFFNTNVEMLKNWRDFLATRLNQRGFHELFKPIKKIGKGNFASVYLAIRLEDDQKFAIKAFSKEATYSEEKGKQSLVNEIELMRKFNHKNLMRLFQVYESQNSIYVSVQLLQGGQLYDKIKAKHKFTNEEIQTIVKGLLMGLEHMHARRVMHRDLKPENILLRKDNDYDCVIADFGLSTWADEPEYLFVRCGTPGYVAPEIVNIKDMKAKCDPICDIFSLGVIFHILLTGKSPFPGKTYNEVLAQNRACNINFETEECLKLPPQTLDLLKKMLERDHLKRITATEALKHPFLKDEVKPNQNSVNYSSDLVHQEENKHPTNKTSILVKKPSMCDSPLMTTSNPLRKANPGPLKDDSCLKFKMKETILTGKTDQCEGGSAIDSPNMKKMMMPASTPKESRFGQERRLFGRRDTNEEAE